ncbi:5-hydroxytryptamine receptor 2B-like [Oppia nitens]|uniref:5-hydroxytryptamine receptor 2B-like n=1 Tax=Oppia nitens TaxID=1686743 RepID=UPI0023DA8594|nr:5-hydroxytryptamine receptor 2B-like [Oppia nitens]
MNETLISSDKIYLLQTFSSILVFIITFITAFGNILVIVAILKTPKLRIRSNYLILSLSLTDLTVALVAMPWTSYLDIIHFSDWQWGPVYCDVYYFITAVCTSASVLHLMFVSIDRYLTVTSINYSTNNKKWYVIVMICFAWLFAVLVGLTPMLGWRDYNRFLIRIYDQKTCFSSLNIAYKTTSVIILFFVPVSVIIPLYCAIYKKSIEFRANHKTIVKGSKVDIQELSTSSVVKTDLTDISKTTYLMVIEDDGIKRVSINGKDKVKQNKSIRREFRVAKTLAIITVCYVICLLPVYMTLLVTVFKNDNQLPKLPFSLTLWLLLCNSGINPIIYAMFNINFRNAFKRLLKL